MNNNNDNNKKSRLAIIAAFMAFVMIIFSFRLIELQLVKGESFRNKVDSTYTSKTSIKAARGEIVDRYGRLLATNKTAYNVIFYKVFMPSSSDEINKMILDLTTLMSKRGEKWIDNLPLSIDNEQLSFVESMENSTANLKKFLGLADYATADHVMFSLRKRYKISDDYNDQQARIIAGVQYEMERTGFSYNVNYTFAQNISSETLTELKEINYKFPGIDVEQEPIREYVSGDVAPHIIGNIGPIYAEEYEKLKEKNYPLNAIIGKSGIESVYEDALRGKDGVRKVVKNKHGDIISDEIEKEPVPGGVVTLTIDKDFQEFVQTALAKNMELIKKRPGASNSKGASVVVLDPKTFEVLALATYPTYQINDYSSKYQELISDPLKPLFNRATQGLYRPGSVFKPSVGASALANGNVSPSEHIYCTGKYTYFQGFTAACEGVHGNTDINKALSVSCNVYFYESARRLGIDALNKNVSFFGFGQPTGIQLYEGIGQLASPEYKKKLGQDWYPADTIQAGIGQSDTEVTPLQLGVYTATLANNGERLNTSIVKEVKSFDYQQTHFKNQKQVISQFDNRNNALESVRKGMIQAATTGSARSAFKDFSFPIAAKTGTPEVVANSVYNGSYIAYGPADDAEIAVAVLAEEIGHGWYLSGLMKEIFNYYFMTQSQIDEIKPNGQLIP